MNLYQKEIIEHAKTSEQNMRVAILAGLSFQELCNSLVCDFANTVKQELQKSWEEVDVREWQGDPIAYSGIACRKNDWPQNIFVKVESQKGGMRENIIGVKAGKNLVSETDRRAIAEQLNAKLAMGKIPTNGWPWYRDLDARYRNFDTVDTLMALYHKKQMVIDLVADINRIGGIVDSIFKK